MELTIFVLIAVAIGVALVVAQQNTRRTAGPQTEAGSERNLPAGWQAFASTVGGTYSTVAVPTGYRVDFIADGWKVVLRTPTTSDLNYGDLSDLTLRTQMFILAPARTGLLANLADQNRAPRIVLFSVGQASASFDLAAAPLNQRFKRSTNDPAVAATVFNTPAVLDALARYERGSLGVGLLGGNQTQVIAYLDEPVDAPARLLAMRDAVIALANALAARGIIGRA